jgi:anion-transporting  ArsA/GET3 family ATPase
MKALVILLSVFFVSFQMNASSSIESKKKKPQYASVESQVTKQINRHFFNPSVTGKDVQGEASVMLEVMPEGNLKVATINTKNPVLKKFIENQVKKMQVDSDQIVVGELFRYKLVFKAQ